jgi:hypothetical protein
MLARAALVHLLAVLGCGRVHFDAPDWRLIADVDGSVSCPGEWVPHTAPLACTVAAPTGGAVRTAMFTAAMPYSEIKGYALGVQFNTTDGFASGPGDSIDHIYVDGLSITITAANGARQHVWSYASGWSNVDFAEPQHHCPCDPGGTPAESFVGSAYFCASGHNDPATPPGGKWFPDDPLWDGMTPGPGCDTGGSVRSFQVTLDTETASPIEARIMTDQVGTNEDVGITRLVLYVR